MSNPSRSFSDDDDFDETEALSESGLKQESTVRILHLLSFLLANEATRQDIFTHLCTYYHIDRADLTEKSALRKADKMFERDISFLEQQGFQVKKKRHTTGHRKYRIEQGSGPYATFLFTQEEVDSLALLSTMFADPMQHTKPDPTEPLPFHPSRHPFAEDILSLIDKLADTLPANQKKHFDRWARQPYVYFNLSAVTNYIPHRATISAIVAAISLRQQIRFDYLPARRKQDSIHHEHIDPYYIIYLEGHFYLIAFSHKMNQFLEYRIDRIKGNTLKMEPNMIDAQRKRSPLEFRFWIDGNIAKRGLSQRWLTQVEEREEVSLDEQGREQRRVLVRATAYNDWRIMQQILRYGDKAELIEPLWLREKLKKTINRMHGLYQ